MIYQRWDDIEMISKWYPNDIQMISNICHFYSPIRLADKYRPDKLGKHRDLLSVTASFEFENLINGLWKHINLPAQRSVQFTAIWICATLRVKIWRFAARPLDRPRCITSAGILLGDLNDIISYHIVSWSVEWGLAFEGVSLDTTTMTSSRQFKRNFLSLSLLNMGNVLRFQILKSLTNRGRIREKELNGTRYFCHWNSFAMQSVQRNWFWFWSKIWILTFRYESYHRTAVCDSGKRLQLACLVVGQKCLNISWESSTTKKKKNRI